MLKLKAIDIFALIEIAVVASAIATAISAVSETAFKEEETKDIS